MTLLLITSLTAAILAGTCKMIADISTMSNAEKTVLFVKFKLNPKWWKKSASANNKWKNGDKSQGEAFWGSSRWFVIFTDAWHLFEFLYDVLLVFSTICICISLQPINTLQLLAYIMLMWLVKQSTFELLHNNLCKT